MSIKFEGPTLEGVAVRLEWIERAIALITLIRPKQMNTLSLELISELNQAIDLVNTPSTRAIIITGQDRAFCCGAHLRYFSGPEANLLDSFEARDKYLTNIAVLFDKLEEMHFPIIAAINGYAMGGGCELALSCDIRVIADHAKIGLPETKLGAVAAAGGVQKLIRHVGRSRALDWILRSTHLDAQTAERWGLCSEVVPGEQLLETALGIALELRRLGPRSVAQSKRCIYLSEDADLRTARRYGLEAISMLVGGKEWKEGMAAFNEKRTPSFDSW